MLMMKMTAVEGEEEAAYVGRIAHARQETHLNRALAPPQVHTDAGTLCARERVLAWARFAVHMAR